MYSIKTGSIFKVVYDFRITAPLLWIKTFFPGEKKIKNIRSSENYTPNLNSLLFWSMRSG